jgi:M6 family metalloprotease-like protein
MRRKHILLMITALLCGFQVAVAIPARPGRFTVTQPDGTRLTLERRGDEWGHWLVNTSGQMVRQEEDGFYRIVSDADAAAFRQVASARRQSARQARARRAARSGGNVIEGQRRFLVILVEFSDLGFTLENPREAYIRMLNETGYSDYGGTGSAREYYMDNSGGRFEPVFDVFGPVTLPEEFAYYGRNDSSGNDQHAEEAVAEGCKALDGEVDFSDYDNDGDGKVDLVFMYYAGYGEADGGSSSTIWPHQWELSTAGVDLTLDGVVLDSYACSNELVGSTARKGEMDGIGTVCHEFGHAIGLPDFYDTDYDWNGTAGGLYSYSLMSAGSYNNDGRTPPYLNFEERMLLGWLDESGYREFPVSGVYEIPPVNENVAYRTFTDMDGEYFVYENRAKTGWDLYLPAEGMVVYHVDKSSRQVGSYTAGELWEDWAMTNIINAKGSHPCFYIVPAARQSSLNYYYESQIPFPRADVDTYVPLSWNKVEGSVSFSGITFEDGMVRLRATLPSEELDYPTIADAGTYRAGERFIFSLLLPEGVDAPAAVSWYYDDEPVAADSVTLTAGDHTVEARYRSAAGREEILTLEITVN